MLWFAQVLNRKRSGQELRKEAFGYGTWRVAEFRFVTNVEFGLERIGVAGTDEEDAVPVRSPQFPGPGTVVAWNQPYPNKYVPNFKRTYL